MKKSKKIILTSIFSIFCLTPFTLFFQNKNITNTNLNLISIQKHALEETNGETSTANYSVKTKQAPLNKTADKVTGFDIKSILTANSSSSSSIPSQFSVIVLPITLDNLSEGYVDFLIIEYKKSTRGYETVFADATKSSNSTTPPPPSTNFKSDSKNLSDKIKWFNSSSSFSSNNFAKENNVFSTKKITNLEGWIQKKDFSISWKDSLEMKQYITNRPESELTIADVYNDLLNKDLLPPLKTTNQTTGVYTEITIKKAGANSGSNSSLSSILGNFNQTAGLYEVTVEIKGLNSSETSKYKDTKYIGGFIVDGESKEVKLSLNTENLSSITITDPNLFNFDGKEIAKQNKKLSDITASEFASPNGGSKKFIELLTHNNKGLSGQLLNLNFDNNKINLNTKPSQDQTQNQTQGQSDTNSSSQTQAASLRSTEQQTNINQVDTDFKIENIKVKNINPIPNDAEGSLELVVDYDSFDVYSGKILNKIETVVFPVDSFKRVETKSDDLIISWKNPLELPLQYSSDIMNAVWRNNDNTRFLKLFSNEFINASSVVKNLERTVKFSYGAIDQDLQKRQTEAFGGGSISGQEYNSNTNSQDVTVSINFENWYAEGKSLTIQKTFKMLGNKYQKNTSTQQQQQPSSIQQQKPIDDTLTFFWKSSNDVLDENLSWQTKTPSDLAYELSISEDKNEVIKNFLLGESITDDKASWYLLPDNQKGTLTVLLHAKIKPSQNNSNIVNETPHIYRQTFVGFKESGISTDAVFSYAYLPQNKINPKLLSIPLSAVTKKNVIDLYLNEIEAFKNKTLTEDDVIINPVIDGENIGASYLDILVKFPFESQENLLNETDKIRNNSIYTRTIIKGFPFVTKSNSTTLSPPKNKTAIIAMTSSIGASVFLGVLLAALLIKRAKLRSFKKSNKELFEDTKKQK